MKNARRGRDEDTIVWHFRSLIHHMTEENPMLRSAIMDGSGNVIGYEDALELVPADSTIISISQVLRTKLVRTADDLESTESGVLVVDENYMTTRLGVFAAYNVVTDTKPWFTPWRPQKPYHRQDALYGAKRLNRIPRPLLIG